MIKSVVCEVKLPRRYGPSRAAIASAEAVLVKAKAAEEKQKQGALIQCTQNYSQPGTACGEWSPISEITYIQTLWYTPPHGCTGGDYWNNGEGQFDCPKCGYRNRLYDSEEATALKRYFKNVVDKEDR